jgi:hypothetical protein
MSPAIRTDATSAAEYGAEGIYTWPNVDPIEPDLIELGERAGAFVGAVDLYRARRPDAAIWISGPWTPESPAFTVAVCVEELEELEASL